ncbi:MAG TPA: hypothetical protein ENN29_01170 [Candidatus Hydrogenedentes bacterium]|nr:hypothetical protein [Candidatus Hydrogenedentota bacterium]
MMSVMYATLILGSVATEIAEGIALIAPPTTESAFREDWTVYPDDLQTRFSSRHDAPTLSLFVERTADKKADWRRAAATVPASAGQRFEAAARGEGNTDGGHGPSVSLSFFDAAHKRIAHTDMFLGNGDTGMRAVKLWAQAPEGTATAQLGLFLHGFGEAHYSDMTVRRLPDPVAPPDAKGVALTFSNEETAKLIGFGFEDDGWFYNEENARRGASEDAVALREKRIEWMRPDYVRMFFWYNDWNPSLDGKTFTWDSDNMLSHYRTLDLYQRLGTRVNVCGVEWAVKKPWEDPERLARAVGALMEHLITRKGYNCIRDYTLTNEPDIFFARAVEREAQSFKTFVRLHECVAAEFDRRGLNLNMVGSDDGNNRSWFERCVNDTGYFNLADLFASHFYFPVNVAPMTKHILADRIALLETRAPRKDFIVAEMGFADERTQPPDKNPLMREYPYAMHAMATFMDGLNAGVTGWSVWCVHEMYYPGGKTPMRFGLWDFDPPQWPVRPIYHALALMTRNTNAGDAVYRCHSSHPDWVKAARIGNHLFWVNLGENETLLTVSGGALISEAFAITEKDLVHDRECARPLQPQSAHQVAVPAHSFGLLSLKMQRSAEFWGHDT